MSSGIFEAGRQDPQRRCVESSEDGFMDFKQVENMRRWKENGMKENVCGREHAHCQDSWKEDISEMYN